jgi:hypothetical protein
MSTRTADLRARANEGLRHENLNGKVELTVGAGRIDVDPDQADAFAEEIRQAAAQARRVRARRPIGELEAGDWFRTSQHPEGEIVGRVEIPDDDDGNAHLEIAGAEEGLSVWPAETTVERLEPDSPAARRARGLEPIRPAAGDPAPTPPAGEPEGPYDAAERRLVDLLERLGYNEDVDHWSISAELGDGAIEARITIADRTRTYTITPTSDQEIR